MRFFTENVFLAFVSTLRHYASLYECGGDVCVGYTLSKHLKLPHTIRRSTLRLVSHASRSSQKA